VATRRHPCQTPRWSTTDDGVEARRFGAFTSDRPLLYDARGTLPSPAASPVAWTPGRERRSGGSDQSAERHDIRNAGTSVSGARCFHRLPIQAGDRMMSSPTGGPRYRSTNGRKSCSPNYQHEIYRQKTIALRSLMAFPVGGRRHVSRCGCRLWPGKARSAARTFTFWRRSSLAAHQPLSPRSLVSFALAERPHASRLPSPEMADGRAADPSHRRGGSRRISTCLVRVAFLAFYRVWRVLIPATIVCTGYLLRRHLPGRNRSTVS